MTTDTHRDRARVRLQAKLAPVLAEVAARSAALADHDQPGAVYAALVRPLKGANR